MDSRDDKKVNNISIIISGIIIAIVVFLVGMLIDYLELPESVIFLMRPVMYAITIIFTQVLIEKVNIILKSSKKS